MNERVRQFIFFVGVFGFKLKVGLSGSVTPVAGSVAPEHARTGGVTPERAALLLPSSAVSR